MANRELEIERICQIALDRPPGDRERFLAEACQGDPALRQEVESLLALEAAAHGFIERPAVDLAASRMVPDADSAASVTKPPANEPVFAAGSGFGNYEIHSMLGSGGMGEVYRARDLKLGRDVALKVLPKAFALDADRVRRFQQEARALAALSHPNIAAIHGFEEVGPVQALVLELVEGPTLAERIAGIPLPLDEAREIATRIAAAVATAHTQGVLHRDLKPANVKVRSDGLVKVLDFGLAKIVNPADAAGGAWASVADGATAPGVLLGTPAYMAPEQLTRHTADRQADIWAFGCVLFEMLVGCPAFDGGTNAEVVSAVLMKEPDWDALPSDTPDSIRRLLWRCLQKDPRNRLHDMADVRFALEDASLQQRQRAVPARTPSNQRERLAWMWAALVLVVALAAAAGSIGRQGASRSPAAERRFDVVVPPTTDPTSFALSPDGRKLVFVATFEGAPRLWLRTFDGSPPRSLAGTEFAAYPFWSPDGASIGFFADLRLKRLDLEGGRVQSLARVEVGFGGTWTRDDTILFSAGPARPITRVPARGGEVHAVTRLADPQAGHRFPQALPDGQRMVYFVSGARETSGIYVARLDGSNPRWLLQADTAATYVASGHLLFVRQGTLYAVDFDPRTLTVAATPFTVADHVAKSTGLGAAAVSASTTGLIAYRQTSGGRQQFIWFDRTGREVGRLAESGDTGPAHPALSPTGDRLAFTRTQGANPDIWLMDVIHGRSNRLTVQPSTEIYPIWSPDGRRIVYGSNRRGRGGLELYQKWTATQEEDELLATIAGMSTVMPEDWSSDGRFIVFRGLKSPAAGFDLWALPLDDRSRPVAVVETEFEERDAQISPDGRWLAYQSDLSGRFEVYAAPFLRPGARVPISAAGGAQVRWRGDGTEVFYITPDGRLMAVPIRISSDGGTLVPGTAMQLARTRTLAGLPGQNNLRPQYVVSPDGQRVLVQSVVSEEASPITVILDWQPAVK